MAVEVVVLARSEVGVAVGRRLDEEKDPKRKKMGMKEEEKKAKGQYEVEKSPSNKTKEETSRR